MKLPYDPVCLSVDRKKILQRAESFTSLLLSEHLFLCCAPANCGDSEKNCFLNKPNPALLQIASHAPGNQGWLGQFLDAKHEIYVVWLQSPSLPLLLPFFV